MKGATILALAREGMKPKAIAARLSITENAVSQSLHRARKVDPTAPRFAGGKEGRRDLKDPALIRSVKRAWNRGEQLKAIGERHNLKPSSVGAIVTRLRHAGQVEGRYCL